jgi:hypothetical protein
VPCRCAGGPQLGPGSDLTAERVMGPHLPPASARSREPRVEGPAAAGNGAFRRRQRRVRPFPSPPRPLTLKGYSALNDERVRDAGGGMDRFPLGHASAPPARQPLPVRPVIAPMQALQGAVQGTGLADLPAVRVSPWPKNPKICGAASGPSRTTPRCARAPPTTRSAEGGRVVDAVRRHPRFEQARPPDPGAGLHPADESLLPGLERDPVRGRRGRREVRGDEVVVCSSHSWPGRNMPAAVEAAEALLRATVTARPRPLGPTRRRGAHRIGVRRRRHLRRGYG